MTEPGAPALVRVARTPADWEAVRSLCCRTGNAGDPIDRARWPLFAELWIGPYQRLVPEWTYVAEVGRAGRRLPHRLPGHRGVPARPAVPGHAPAAVPGSPAGATRGTATPGGSVRLALRLHRGVESRLAPGLPAGLTETHPAHLHMNVEAECRRRGIGVALIERYARDLGAAGVPGIHLFCGAAPRPFYARNGFTELAALEVSPGRWVYALGRRLGRRDRLRDAGGRPAAEAVTAGGA